MNARRWWLLTSLLPLTVCGLIAGVYAMALVSPAEVPPPPPSAELISTSTLVDSGGPHTVRAYRVPVSMRQTLNWYFHGDLGRFGRRRSPLQEFRYSFMAAAPPLPFPAWALARITSVHFIDRGAHTEVVTDTRYYWHYLAP